MPYYSREDCERVRGANDIVDVISSYVRLEKRGSRYFGLCPFHNEKTGSFCVSADTQLYHCFGCHESGNVVSFLMRYESMEFVEAIESLAERAGIELKSESPGPEARSGDYRKRREALLAANKAAAGYYYKKLREPEGERGLNYFRERGLNASILHSFGLGYTGPGSVGLYKFLKGEGFEDEVLKEAGLVTFDEKNGVRDRFFNRVMFPIMDANRHVIAFGARVMGDGQPKYLNSAESPIFNKSNTLYGLFAARRSRRPQIIVCEGYMDVISLHMAGFDNAVATLGTALTEGHATLLSRFKRPVYLCYDSDEAGKKAAVRGYEILNKANINCKIINLGEFKDPDELIKAKGAEGFEECLNKAANAFYTIRRWEYESFDHSDPDAMSDFLRNLSEKIMTLRDETTRETYIKAMAPMFNVDENMLRRWVNEKGDRTYKELRPATRFNEKTKGITRELAIRTNEARLLYYLTDSDFYQRTKGIIERDDFITPEFKEIFDRITEDANGQRDTVPADLIGSIEDAEVVNFLSEIFVKTEDEDRSDTEGSAKNKKAVLKRIKQSSVRRASSTIGPKDVEKLQKSMEINKELFDEIEKLEFK